MSECPRCHQTVDVKAVTCPYCRTTLKAFGHPGIPLHRATGDESLCESCMYHADDTCNYPQRPYASECTMYQNLAEANQPEVWQNYRSSVNFFSLQKWIQRNPVWVILVGLLIISLLLSI